LDLASLESILVSPAAAAWPTGWAMPRMPAKLLVPCRPRLFLSGCPLASLMTGWRSSAPDQKVPGGAFWLPLDAPVAQGANS